MRRALTILAALVLFGACSDEDETTPPGAGSTASGGHGGGVAGSGPGGDGATGGEGGTASGGNAGSGGQGAGGSGSTGCGNAGAPTGVLDQSIQANGKDRQYVLFVPGDYDPNTPIALVFAWHGAGGNGVWARLSFGLEGAASGQAIFVYPHGLLVQTGTTGWDLTSDGDDVLLFDAVRAELEQAYCIDSERIFSTGHSFGGYFSNALGCARGDVLRAIAPVAGGGPNAANCTGPLAAWIAHGTVDPTVPIAVGMASRNRWRDENGCSDTTGPVSPSPCEAYDGCGSATPLTWCAHFGGHEWPAFAAEGIWGFFAALP